MTNFPPYKLQKTSDLIPYARNARTHSDAQVAKIASSIREFGFTNPVLTDGDKGIIAGHGRVLAARKLGMMDVPTVELSHLNAQQRKAYIMADNRLALDAGWDNALLSLELAELKDDGFDLKLTGFDDAELAALLAGPNDGLTDPDDVPEPQADAITVMGDVWVLGKHRLVCGDSTDAGAVEAVLAGVKPHLMVTDPPYGVEYDASWRNDAVQAGNGKRGAPSGRAIGKVENDTRADWAEAWALFPGDVAYVWHAALFASTVAASLEATGFKLRSQIIWKKSNFAIGRGHYHWHHEPCWYAAKSAAHWQGDRKQSTIWEIPKPAKSETGHSTQKPVECMKRPIENNSSPGQAVYEPFSGSGTTIIAGEMTGRCVHAIELSPQYVDVAVRRWQAFSGQTATLESDGRTFAEVEAARESPLRPD